MPEICVLGEKARCASPTVCEPGTNYCVEKSSCTMCVDGEKNRRDWVCKADETGKPNWYCESSDRFY